MPERNRWTVAMALPSGLVGTSRQSHGNRPARVGVTVAFAEVARAEILEDERHHGYGGRFEHAVSGTGNERERGGRQTLGEALRVVGRGDVVVLSPEEEDRNLALGETALAFRPVGRGRSDQDECVDVVPGGQLEGDRAGTSVRED